MEVPRVPHFRRRADLIGVMDASDTLEVLIGKTKTNGEHAMWHSPDLYRRFCLIPDNEVKIDAIVKLQHAFEANATVRRSPALVFKGNFLCRFMYLP